MDQQNKVNYGNFRPFAMHTQGTTPEQFLAQESTDYQVKCLDPIASSFNIKDIDF